MIAPLFTRHSLIGVDVGSRCVKAVQLDRRRARPRIAAAAIYRRAVEGDVTAETVDELRQVLRRRGFVGSRIALAAPHHAVRTSLLELPGRSAVDTAQLSRMEMARIHRLAPGSFEFACWPAPNPAAADKAALQVMAYACPHREADALLDLFEDGGLHVAALDLESAALSRACRDLLGAGDEMTLIASLGWRSCHVIALRGPVITYERTLADITLASVRDRVASALGGDEEAADHLLLHGGATRADLASIVTSYGDRVAEELRACGQYLRGRTPTGAAGRVLIAGGGAELPGLTERLARSADMPVEALSLSRLADRAESLTAPAGMALALGLARHGERD